MVQCSEMAFCDLEQLMDVEEDFLKTILVYIIEKCDDELTFLENFTKLPLRERMKKVIHSQIARVSHKEAIRILRESGEQLSLNQSTAKILPKSMRNILRKNISRRLSLSMIGQRTSKHFICIKMMMNRQLER